MLSPLEQSIKRKIESKGVPLKDWDISINYGIKTGYNEAFIISGEKKDELIAEDPKSAEIIRPILRGKDIKRYKASFADLWLIVSHNGNRKTDTDRIDIDDYPAIKRHLDTYYEKIAKRDDQGDTPYNLRNCAYMDDFSRQKIIFQEMVQEPAFYLDKNTHYFCLDTGRIITGDHLPYLLALMNSKLFFYAIKKFYGGGGLGSSGVRMKHSFFEKFNAVLPAPDEENIFSETEEITDEEIRERDLFFYNVYDLSEEEVNLIENDLSYQAL